MLSSTLVCKQSKWIQQGCLWTAWITPAEPDSSRILQRSNKKKSDFSFFFFFPDIIATWYGRTSYRSWGFAEARGCFSPSSFTRSNPWMPENDCGGPQQALSIPSAALSSLESISLLGGATKPCKKESLPFWAQSLPQPGPSELYSSLFCFFSAPAWLLPLAGAVCFLRARRAVLESCQPPAPGKRFRRRRKVCHPALYFCSGATNNTRKAAMKAIKIERLVCQIYPSLMLPVFFFLFFFFPSQIESCWSVNFVKRINFASLTLLLGWIDNDIEKHQILDILEKETI